VREAVVCWYACAPNATLILMCVCELMRAKKQAKISLPPARPMIWGAARSTPFKTPGRGKLKSLKEGFSTE